MDDERSCGGSAFQTAETATRNSVGRAVFLYKHVVVFCRTKICQTRNAGDWDADVVEVGRSVLTDTVKRRDCYLELYSLWH